ncbi:DUF4301 family protein [Ulvibacterium sp.]|uniref:DUF4301 family protein n=1 Tax=Ulvibacterium sp. TaxID=2665914 RepID=UPI003BAB7105
MIRLSEKDWEQLENKGITKETVVGQIETFKEGIPFVRLEKAAVIGDGISKFSEDQQTRLVRYFEENGKALRLLKFVPASGAASRMFKALFNFLDTYDPDHESLEDYLERTKDIDLKKFSEGLKDLPFYDLVRNRIAEKANIKGKEIYVFVKEMMSENTLNYGFYPKGLLPFHNYGEYVATPFEEHLTEAANYAKTGSTANLHFTISPQHEEMFNKEFSSVKERVSVETNTSFQVGYSYQKPSTDTIAVDMENNPFRNTDGSLLFRPGGHGALIENLNEQDADIIFIKNIDNVVVPEVLEEVSDSKKTLAGVLLEVQQKAFEYARFLDGDPHEKEKLGEIKDFLTSRLNVRFSDNFSSLDTTGQVRILKDKVNRPIRVCGMVKNEGEPGGGPFWIRDRHDTVSLQIVESAQVDMNDSGQVAIFRNSTHFNPVDLVCGIKDYRGAKYDLLNFIDPKQGFITGKTKEGRELKALELPGLWNGAMAFWNTIFVEVPLSTFNPVKTVNDLLKPSHQVS